MNTVDVRPEKHRVLEGFAAQMAGGVVRGVELFALFVGLQFGCVKESFGAKSALERIERRVVLKDVSPKQIVLVFLREVAQHDVGAVVTERTQTAAAGFQVLEFHVKLQLEKGQVFGADSAFSEGQFGVEGLMKSPQVDQKFAVVFEGFSTQAAGQRRVGVGRQNVLHKVLRRDGDGARGALTVDQIRFGVEGAS